MNSLLIAVARDGIYDGGEKTMLTLLSFFTVCLIKHLQVNIFQVYQEVVNHKGDGRKR